MSRGRIAAKIASKAVISPSPKRLPPRITAFQSDACVSAAGRSTNTRHPNEGMTVWTDDTAVAGPLAPNVLPSMGSSEGGPASATAT